MVAKTPINQWEYPEQKDRVDDARFFEGALIAIDKSFGSLKNETVSALNVAVEGIPGMVASGVTAALSEDSTILDAAAAAAEAAANAKVAEAMEDLAANGAVSYAAQEAPAYMLASSPGDGDMRPPRVISEKNIIVDSGKRIVDGAKFFAPIKVAGLPGTWLDTWYGYIAGHDSETIWLMTAPDLMGPWSWVEPVIGVPGSGAKYEDSTFQIHTSSPDVFYRNGLFYLTYHGPLASNGLTQPTAVATSTDGRSFTDRGVVINTDYSNQGSPYRTSTSYVCVARHGGLYHAIWQGTTGRDSFVEGYQYSPVPVGYATSVDGLQWVIRQPILTSGSKDQGLFAPGLFRMRDGWLVVGAYRAFNGAGGQVESVRAFYGSTLEQLRYIGDIILPGQGRTQSLNSPKFVVHSGKLFMVAGTRAAGATVPNISVFELNWG